MTDRLTPEQIAARSQSDIEWSGPAIVLDNLREHGYVIVHPDDVPVLPEDWHSRVAQAHRNGWNDCRTSIFGESS